MTMHTSHPNADRRRFLACSSSAAGLMLMGAAAGVEPPIAFSDIAGKSEAPERLPAGLPNGQRVGFAIVGLGRLSVGHILPAFGRCERARCTALVSGDRAKAQALAREYGVSEDALFGYDDFERLQARDDVQVVYIVLPNAMHAEYTLRAAKIGKHVLCEKPMAVSVADAQRMVDACAAAGVWLMIGYRSQYEPNSRAVVEFAGTGKLGTIQQMISSNSQNMGDPQHWRLKRALAGGGPLPDVGLYCINAARFLTSQEPSRVIASLQQPKSDPRFREVESAVQFVLEFPSGFTATCSTSYATHKSQFLRLEGSDAWAEMDPAFAYRGIALRTARFDGNTDTVTVPRIEEVDQFAKELDHMATCVKEGRKPHTPGEEGVQDQRIIEAIYRSAASGHPVDLQVPNGPVRGPPLESAG
jgi:predicted dehydrogenase